MGNPATTNRIPGRAALIGQREGRGCARMRPMPKPHRWALAIFAVIFAASWWHPLWPVEQGLHHSLTVLALIGLIWAQRRLKLPLSSFVLALAFLTLHT